MKKTVLNTALLTFLASTQFAIAQDQLDTRQISGFALKKPPKVLIDLESGIEMPWKAIDVNNDEKISKEEFLDAARQFAKRKSFTRSKSFAKFERIFAMQDLNKDGFLTKKEIIITKGELLD